MNGVKVLGIPIRAHPTLLLMLLLAIMTGSGERVPIVVLSLTAHEFSHALVAQALKVHVRELELMPFGGAARIDDLWTLRSSQVIPVALAGPCVNLLIAITCAALAWGGLMTPARATLWLQANLSLLLFNLIPALPLDGGRVFCAWLGARVGQTRALRIGIWMGRLLAVFLMALTAAALWQHRRLNLSPLLCAVFLLASAEGERQAAEGATLISLLSRQAELAGEGVLPVQWLAVCDSASMREVLRQLKPRSIHRIAVYDERLHLHGVVEEEELVEAIKTKSQATIGALLPPRAAP